MDYCLALKNEWGNNTISSKCPIIALASPTHIKDDQPAGGFTKSHRPWSVKRLVPAKSEKGHSWRSRDDHLEYQNDHQQIIATKWGDLGQTSLTIVKRSGNEGQVD